MEQTFQPPAVRHEKHWIAYGNIVLAAVSSKQPEPATILFRIHSSLLSEHSEVFASMFELPQGGEGSQVEMCDGLPVVRLPDTSEEVCGLLDALRDPLPLAIRNYDSDTPLRIRNALYMASKYLMNSLQTNLIRILEKEWPCNVEDLEIMDQYLVDYAGQDVDGARIEPDCFSDGWPQHVIPEPAAAVALAEDFDITSILPAAYYDLLRCNPSRDWDTFQWTIASIMRPCGKPARWNRLSARSWWKMHRLQGVLYDEADNVLRDLQSVYPDVNDSEHSARKCRSAWSQLVEAALVSPPESRDRRDIFKQLRTIRVEAHEDSDICEECEWVYADATREARNSIWEEIERVCSSLPDQN